jgi:type I restriction enzyme S subunit
MQVQKPRKGYKLVKSLFGKYEEIPEEWRRVRLIEVCSKKPEYGAAVSAIEKNPELPRYIRITDLNEDGSLREEEWKSISENDANDYLLNEGDIIFARTGATVGKTYLYQKKDGKCAFAGYLIRFITDKTKLNPNFLFYYTHFSNYWKWLKSIQTWGVQPNVNAEQYSKMPILLPPINEQQKIASILSNVDSLIQQTQKEIEQTQRLKKGLMQKLLTKGIGHTKFKKVKRMLGKEIEIPLDWQIKNLDEVSEIIDPWPSHRAPPEKNDGIPYLGIGDFDENGTIVNISRYVDNSVFEKQKQIFNLENGDIAIGRVASIGKIVRLNTVSNYAISPTLSIIKPKMNRNYLIQALKSNYFQKELRYNIKGSTRSSVGIQLIRKLKVLLPSEKEQQRISSILSNVDSKIQKLQEYKTKLESLKKGLMQKLLTGQIRVKI